ncbi:helix-turn-helix domain-containing protein [Pseudacidovorax sp. RU35E]|uniref:helix-turn-helix domain-containing protein n=1 Tax=Pseudacidovorax sp. RU35E TaxID=1907403 RepID=UPI000954F364|nr:helix-turn-helix domain-containing protein [Pseudacidovorax sp. RU35E]SIR05997.1 transcriptional regulator, Nlp family [Pseudacidovorax sp. RU35E]
MVMKPRYRLHTDGALSLVYCPPDYFQVHLVRCKQFLTRHRATPARACKPMDPERIKAGLRMKGVTPAAIAEQLGVSTPTMSQVISGRSVSARIRNRIAEILGKPVDEIWPPAKKPPLRRTKAQLARAAA